MAAYRVAIVAEHGLYLLTPYKRLPPPFLYKDLVFPVKHGGRASFIKDPAAAPRSAHIILLRRDAKRPKREYEVGASASTAQQRGLLAACAGMLVARARRGYPHLHLQEGHTAPPATSDRMDNVSSGESGDRAGPDAVRVRSSHPNPPPCAHCAYHSEP